MKPDCTHHSWLSCSVLCVICAAYFSAAKVGVHQSPLPEEQRRMQEHLQRKNQDRLHVLEAS